MSSKPFTVGLTGGIASGKTVVAELFRELGAEIIDSDAIAKALVAPGLPAYKAIIAHFGQAVLNPDKSLNRRWLRQRIFDNQPDKTWMEQLLHPKIREAMQKAQRESQAPYVIFVIPLLAETLPNPALDRILVVHSDQHTRIQRLMTRDHCTEAEALSAIQNQTSDEARLAIADDIIENQGDMASLKAQVSSLHKRYARLTE